MPFTSNRMVNDDYEVIMEAGTLCERYGYPKNARRRFAYCTHENDAEVIAEALNALETEGKLR